MLGELQMRDSIAAAHDIDTRDAIRCPQRRHPGCHERGIGSLSHIMFPIPKLRAKRIHDVAAVAPAIMRFAKTLENAEFTGGTRLNGQSAQRSFGYRN
jgi:hypothetical protein